MDLPYGTMSDDEMRRLPVSRLQRDGAVRRRQRLETDLTSALHLDLSLGDGARDRARPRMFAALGLHAGRRDCCTPSASIAFIVVVRRRLISSERCSGSRPISCNV